MANKDIRITEQALLKRMDEMCAESLPPDIYSLWADAIVPKLNAVRRGLQDKSDICPSRENDRLLIENRDLQRRNISHIKGEAVKHVCRDCLKNFWNVDDENISCPFCGSKEFPIADPDAEIIAKID